MSVAGYVNPFLGAGAVHAERIDQGQDFALTPGAPIGAIGPGVIDAIIPNWFEGQPLIEEQLTGGSRKGTYTYYAEQLTPTVHVGQKVHAGQVIAHVAPSGTGLELGFGAGGGRTLAQATTGYTEGQATSAGTAFSSFLHELGVQTASGTTSTAPKTTKCGGLNLPGPLGILCKPIELEREALQGIEGAVGEGVSKVGEEAVKGAIDVFKPIGVQITLLGVLIVGAMVMIVYGFSEMLKPLGGPDIKRKAFEAAGAAAVAA